jgi:hypothetical protein
MAVDPAQIDLTPEQRRRLASLAEQTGRGWTELVDDLLDLAPAALESQSTAAVEPNGEAAPAKSLYDVLTERGILGCFDGPTDLSTNPKHMEGFGDSRFPKNSR